MDVKSSVLHTLEGHACHGIRICRDKRKSTRTSEGLIQLSQMSFLYIIIFIMKTSNYTTLLPSYSDCTKKLSVYFILSIICVYFRLLRSKLIYEQGSPTDTIGASVLEGLVLCSVNELVGDVAVDPDAAHAKCENSQRVLVVVGQRARADCTDGEGNKPFQHMQNSFLNQL